MTLPAPPHATRAPAPGARDGVPPRAATMDAQRLLGTQRTARRDRRRRARWGFVAGLLATHAAVVPAAALQRVTTIYAYNADGALTAATRQQDGAAAATTYLTWANFTPEAGDPSAGTARAADANLIRVGPQPGASGAALLDLAYDQRDRLLRCRAAAQAGAVDYTYHPASALASSTLASGDSLRFHYDNRSSPRLVNVQQPLASRTASFLGPAYFADGGSEQIQLQPRQDVAGVFSPAEPRLAPLAYEPYGSERHPAERNDEGGYVTLPARRSATQASTRIRPTASTTCAPAGTCRSGRSSCRAIRPTGSTATATRAGTR